MKLLLIGMGMAGSGLRNYKTDGKAGKFGFVPICYIKIALRKHSGNISNHLGKFA
jgi:hypothetical protein